LKSKVLNIVDMVRRLLFCDADFCISVGRIYYRQSLGCVHKRRDRSCSFPFPFFFFSPCLSASRYLVRLLGIPCRFRAQIFADTPLNVQRSGGGTPSRNLGSPQICPRQIFTYWYAGSALAPRVPTLPRTPFVFYRRLLRLLRVEFLRVLISSVSLSRSIVHLVKRLLTEGDPSEVDPLHGS
jgi:hypothetical protein